MKFVLFFTTALAILPAVSFAQLTETEKIRTELQELKAHYESRIQDLEERLQQLEAGHSQTDIASSTKVTTRPRSASQIPSVNTFNEKDPLSGEKVDGFSSRNMSQTLNPFLSQTEYRYRQPPGQDSLYDERVEHVLEDYLDINGYLRAGFGVNDKGSSQVGFIAPTAPAKYRLGNEAENFGELIFGKNIYPPERFDSDASNRPSEGPIARVQARLDFYNPHDSFSSGGSTVFSFPEAWASIRNVWHSQPNAKFWAGNRYYRRHDIHIDDFFFWNMSGGGGGVEDIELKSGAKLALAWIGWGKRSSISDLPEPDPENEAGFSKTNLDLRLYDWALLGGHAELGLVYSRVRSGLDANGIQAPDTNGYALNFVQTNEKLFTQRGVNKFSIQFGENAAKTFTSGFETFSNDIGTFIKPDREDSWRVRVLENYTADLSDSFSISGLLVYQYTDYGEGFGENTWASAGVRPVFHFNEKLSIALEAGLDFVDDESLAIQDTLLKLTVAPQIAIGNFFDSRPVIRAYATWADWGDAFEGLVGGNDYLQETSGANFGVQMETWW